MDFYCLVFTIVDVSSLLSSAYYFLNIVITNVSPSYSSWMGAPKHLLLDAIGRMPLRYRLPALFMSFPVGAAKSKSLDKRFHFPKFSAHPPRLRGLWSSCEQCLHKAIWPQYSLCQWGLRVNREHGWNSLLHFRDPGFCLRFVWGYFVYFPSGKSIRTGASIGNTFEFF